MEGFVACIDEKLNSGNTFRVVHELSDYEITKLSEVQYILTNNEEIIAVSGSLDLILGDLFERIGHWTQ